MLPSAMYCSKYAALSSATLMTLPASAKGILTAVGCLCISDPAADSASKLDPGVEPLTAALAATSERLAVPLEQLASIGRLGSCLHEQLRHLLAQHLYVYGPRQQRSAWSVLRQLRIFEGSADTRVSLPVQSAFGLLPSADWEYTLLDVPRLLPYIPVRYHTASATQQALVQHSSMPRLEAPKFLCSVLLPQLLRSPDNSRQQLLHKALTEISAHPELWSMIPPQIITHGRILHLGDTVDSTSETLFWLFKTRVSGKTGTNFADLSHVLVQIGIHVSNNAV